MKRPSGHTPVAPAWTTIGLPPQTISSMLYSDDSSDDSESLTSCLVDGASLPSHVERARVLTGDGRTTVFLAYWTDPVVHNAWRSRSDVKETIDRPGVLEETATIPADYWETLHSTDETTPGIRNLFPAQATDVHEYWGAARDRITASSTERLEHRTAAPLPGNLCLIRSGQVWHHCGDQEREIYFERVQPKLQAGVEYLRSTPSTGCLSARFLREQTIDGQDLEATSFIGWFIDLAALESWASSDPTHLAIFDAFLAMVGDLGGDIALRLWHEVAVLPQGAVTIAGGGDSPLLRRRAAT